MTNNRIQKAFEKPGAFISFITAGDPDVETTIECVKKMAEAGSDLIELGVPFSDPCAEGPVIEAADVRALNNGMDTHKVFDIISRVRDLGIDVPIVLLTYYNPVYKYGTDAFLKKLKEVGGDGIIIPDMPFEESDETRQKARKEDLCLISLIAPTSNERIDKIAKNADGFIYIVSSMGTTGVRTEITTDIESIVERIRKNTDLPTAVGFGIATPEQAERMCKTADGAIVGSAIVKIMEEYGKDSPEYVFEYVKKMKEGALKGAINRG